MRAAATIGMTSLQNLYHHQRHPLALASEQEEYFHGGSALQRA
jgi:hypothetical protein